MTNSYCTLQALKAVHFRKCMIKDLSKTKTYPQKNTYNENIYFLYCSFIQVSFQKKKSFSFTLSFEERERE